MTAPRMVTWRGKTQSIADWARELGFVYNTLAHRLKKYPVEKAMTMPLWDKPEAAPVSDAAQTMDDFLRRSWVGDRQ